MIHIKPNCCHWKPLSHCRRAIFVRSPISITWLDPRGFARDLLTGFSIRSSSAASQRYIINIMRAIHLRSPKKGTKKALVRSSLAAVNNWWRPLKWLLRLKLLPTEVGRRQTECLKKRSGIASANYSSFAPSHTHCPLMMHVWNNQQQQVN